MARERAAAQERAFSEALENSASPGNRANSPEAPANREDPSKSINDQLGRDRSTWGPDPALSPELTPSLDQAVRNIDRQMEQDRATLGPAPDPMTSPEFASPSPPAPDPFDRNVDVDGVPGFGPGPTGPADPGFDPGMDPGGLGPAGPGTTDPGFDPGMDPGGLGPADPGTPGTTDPGFDPGMDPGGLGPASPGFDPGMDPGGLGPAETGSAPDTSGEGGDDEPVILDLDGDGLSIVQRDASTMTYDMAGDGLQHRTAWVGKGDGVLAIDADGDGKITERREIIFTDWDPGAGSDMKALRSVFDTNHNGRLDAGDARFADFRVVVDGQVKTLAELGIVSIDLVTDGAPRRYADGSSIEGRSTFTRADGSTGTAADASFVSDADGWRMDKTSVTGADGRRTDTLTARAVDGTLVSQTVSVTSADGSETTTGFDDDGDGLVDRRQVTRDTTTAGGRVTAVRFYDRQGALRGSITTARYNAGALEIVELDRDGDGRADQGQRYEALADGSSATTITVLNPDGTIRSVQRTTVSADGLDRVVSEAPVGQTVVTGTRTLTAYAADGTRTDTATVMNADGTLRAGSVTVTSADGRAKTVSADRDGSGLPDLVQASVLTTDADGRIRSVVTTKSDNATLLWRTMTLSTANIISIKTFARRGGRRSHLHPDSRSTGEGRRIRRHAPKRQVQSLRRQSEVQPIPDWENSML
jgi:hypothetical protein